MFSPHLDQSKSKNLNPIKILKLKIILQVERQFFFFTLFFFSICFILIFLNKITALIYFFIVITQNLFHTRDDLLKND